MKFWKEKHLLINSAIDWSSRPETPDTTAICDEIARRGMHVGRRILQIGIGNNSAFLKLSDCEIFHGITVCEKEYELAKPLQNEKYRIYLMNKFTPHLLSIGPVDIIIENAPAGFTYCKYCLYSVLTMYELLIRPSAGALVSHEIGIRYGSFKFDSAALQKFIDEYEIPLCISERTKQGVVVFRSTKK